MTQENDDDDDDETDSDSDDEEFTEDPLLSKPQNGQVETTGPSQLSAPPLQTSVSGGTKRPREEGEEEEASDYGESEETGQVVNKKARAAAEEEV